MHLKRDGDDCFSDVNALRDIIKLSGSIERIDIGHASYWNLPLNHKEKSPFKYYWVHFNRRTNRNGKIVVSYGIMRIKER